MELYRVPDSSNHFLDTKFQQPLSKTITKFRSKFYIIPNTTFVKTVNPHRTNAQCIIFIKNLFLIRLRYLLQNPHFPKLLFHPTHHQPLSIQGTSCWISVKPIRNQVSLRCQGGIQVQCIYVIQYKSTSVLSQMQFSYWSRYSLSVLLQKVSSIAVCGC